jgi:hypothetical protein
MTFSGSMNLATSYMVQNTSSQAITNNLFEKTLTNQQLFHSESKIPALGGNSAIIFSLSIQSDGDASPPIASVSINGSDSITARVGNQIASSSINSQRSYISTNPIITTKSNIELSTNISDSGDLVYTNQFTMMILPIKD